MRTFISYSHHDEQMLKRLHTHLSMLRRQGLISSWHDRDILAGSDLDSEIEAQLKTCELFLALVSPDFLGSNYCYEREMQTALRRHANNELTVVPIIVEPCEWKESPLKDLKALPKDGKPITEWMNPNTAFLDVATELRKLLQARQYKEPEPSRARSVTIGSEPKRPQYRAPRDFDEIERSEFADTAFAAIREHFSLSIKEINTVDGLRGRYRSISDVAFTCSILNRLSRDSASHITVHVGPRRSGFGIGDITYSFEENASPNHANGWISVDSDKYELFLSMNSFDHGDKKRMSAEQVAKWLWDLFLEKGGILHE